MQNKIMFQAGPTGGVPNWGKFVREMSAKGLSVFAAVTDTRAVYDDILAHGATGSRVNWRPTEGPLPHEMRTFAPEWQDHWGQGKENRYQIDKPDLSYYKTKQAAIESYQRGADYHIRATLIRAKDFGVDTKHPFVTVKTWNEVRNKQKHEGKDEPPPAGFSDWFDAMGWQAYYIGKELVRRKATGQPWFRWSAFGFAGGNPHVAGWETEGMLMLLRLCAEYPDVLGICLHEYSFTRDIWRGFEQRDFIGRFERLFAVCTKHGIKKPWVEIAEWGWEEADIPDHDIAIQHIKEVSAYYAKFTEIKLAAIWTTRKWHGNAGIHEKVQGLASALYDFSLSFEGGQVEPTPVPTPTPMPTTSDNLLDNPNFDSGWKTLQPSGNQQPNGWDLVWAKEGERCTPDGLRATRELEIVHKLNKQLPPHEKADSETPLILSGNAVFKAFISHGRGAMWLSQSVEGLLPHQPVEFSVNAQVHFQNKQNEDDDVGLHLVINGQEKGWHAGQLDDRRWNLLRHEGKADKSGRVRVVVYWFNRYLNSRDIFLENARLVALAEPPITPPQSPPTELPNRKVLVNLISQKATEAQAGTVLKAAYPKRQTMTFSLEDAAALLAVGNGESELIEWNFDDKPAGNPLVGLKLGSLFNVPFQVTSRFNDPRSYGNGLHEGVDFDIIGGAADSKEPILCPYDGTIVYARKVTSRGEPSAYGWHYRVKSENNGSTFYYWIAHTDELFKGVGDDIELGDEIAELGGTGETGKGRFAEHVHFNLEVPGYGLSGYVVRDVVDPLPYFNNEQPIKYYAHTTAKNGLRLRAEPSSKGKILDIMAFNSRVAVYEDSSGWRKIRYNNVVGYTWHSYLKKEQTDTIDLLPYLRGDDKRHFELKYTWHGGGTHPTQSQWGADGVFNIVKGHSGEYEMLYADDDWIYRGEDTSEAPDRFYVQTTNGRYGAMWCKRHMAIGERVQRDPFVKHYYKDCRPRKEGTHVSGLTLQKRHNSYTFESGIKLDDVIEMTWDSGERYWFAKGWGLVGFEYPEGKSWISEVHEGRRDLNRNQVKCLPLVKGERFYL